MTIYYSEKEILDTEIYCPLHNNKTYRVFHPHGYEFSCSGDNKKLCNFEVFLFNIKDKYHLTKYDLYFKRDNAIFCLNSACATFTGLKKYSSNYLLDLPFIDIPLKNFNEESEKIFNRLLKLVVFK